MIIVIVDCFGFCEVFFEPRICARNTYGIYKVRTNTFRCNKKWRIYFVEGFNKQIAEEVLKKKLSSMSLINPVVELN